MRSDPEVRPPEDRRASREYEPAQVPGYADWEQDLLRHSQDLHCVHDLEGHLISANPIAARLLGYTVEELLRIPMRELAPPRYRHQFDEYLRVITQHGEAHGLLSVLTRAGEERIWEYHSRLRTEGLAKSLVRGIAHDVTERVMAETELRAAIKVLTDAMQQQESTLRDLRLFRALIDESNDGIEVIDPATMRFLDVNEKTCCELGYTRDELLRMTVFDINPQVTQECVARGIEEMRAPGFVILETVHQRKDGTKFPVEVNIKRVGLDREYLIANSRDISERKRAEAALRSSEETAARTLRESEERLRLAQEVAGIGTFDRNFVTGEVRWTPQTEEIFGLPPGGVPRTVDEFLKLVHPEDRAQVARVVARSMESGLGHGEWRVVWPDGTVRWISGRWKVFKDASGLPERLIGADYDISDRKRIEEELRQAQERLTEEKLYLEQQIDAELGFEEILGQSQALKAVLERVAKVADTDATVLLLGETGTGKELVARAIHRLSRRAGSAFIKTNCAAIPSGLMESELFGHEKGAFTGAVARKIGRLELADKGTLFLDEIGEIPLLLQPKLLRVLQDMEFERLGGTQTTKVNFRLIAATNRDLAEGVRENEFRSDLYYRLNVFPIRIPPLRERVDDIRLLTEYFVHKFARKMNKNITSIPKQTIDILMQWEWPGNVRELENFIERSVILTHGRVLVSPLSELQPPAETNADETLATAEREHILRALRETRGRISGPRGAAARLGLKRTTLQSKLKQMGIDRRATWTEKQVNGK